MSRAYLPIESPNHPWAHLKDSFHTITCSDRSSQEWEQATARINAAVLRAASQILMSPSHRQLLLDPQDIAQLWWIRMLTGAFDQWDPLRGHLYAYCYRTLRNLCLDAARRARVRQAKHLPTDRAVTTLSPCAEAQFKEQRQRVRVAVRCLPRHLRKVATLRYLRCLSPQEVADLCGMTKSLVIGRSYAARRLLRKRLAD